MAFCSLTRWFWSWLSINLPDNFHHGFLSTYQMILIMAFSPLTRWFWSWFSLHLPDDFDHGFLSTYQMILIMAFSPLTRWFWSWLSLHLPDDFDHGFLSTLKRSDPFLGGTGLVLVQIQNIHGYNRSCRQRLESQQTPQTSKLDNMHKIYTRTTRKHFNRMGTARSSTIRAAVASNLMSAPV